MGNADFTTNKQTIMLNCGEQWSREIICHQQKTLEKAIQNKCHVIFVVSEIKSIDMAGLQFLVWYTVNAKKSHLTWEWQAPSDLFLNMAKISGVSRLLNLPDQSRSEGHVT